MGKASWERDSSDFSEKSHLLIWFAIAFSTNREAKGNVLGTLSVDPELHDKHIGRQIALSLQEASS